MIKDAKGHEDQNDLDGRTRLVSLGHFCLRYLPKEVIVKGAKSQVWKTVVVGVFLEDNATGVFGESYTIKDSRQTRGQSNLGKLPLTERLELSAN